MIENIRANKHASRRRHRVRARAWFFLRASTLPVAVRKGVHHGVEKIVGVGGVIHRVGRVRQVEGINEIAEKFRPGVRGEEAQALVPREPHDERASAPAGEAGVAPNAGPDAGCTRGTSLSLFHKKKNTSRLFASGVVPNHNQEHPPQRQLLHSS